MVTYALFACTLWLCAPEPLQVSRLEVCKATAILLERLEPSREYRCRKV